MTVPKCDDIDNVGRQPGRSQVQRTRVWPRHCCTCRILLRAVQDLVPLSPVALRRLGGGGLRNEWFMTAKRLLDRGDQKVEVEEAEAQVGLPPPPLGACIALFFPPFRAWRRLLACFGSA